MNHRLSKIYPLQVLNYYVKYFYQNTWYMLHVFLTDKLSDMPKEIAMFGIYFKSKDNVFSSPEPKAHR